MKRHVLTALVAGGLVIFLVALLRSSLVPPVDQTLRVLPVSETTRAFEKAKTRFVFVNGIDTDSTRVSLHLRAIDEVVRDAGFAIDYPVVSYHNKAGGLVKGFGRTLSDARAIIRGLDVTRAAAIRFADSVNVFLQRGEGVVIVAHSHGNLLVQLALPHFYVSEGNERPCVAVVALGSPLRRTGSTGYDRSAMTSLSGYYVEGDIVYAFSDHIDTPDSAMIFPAVSTYTSRRLLKENPRTAAPRLHLHGLQESYLIEQARARLKRLLVQSHERLRQHSCGVEDVEPSS